MFKILHTIHLLNIYTFKINNLATAMGPSLLILNL